MKIVYPTTGHQVYEDRVLILGMSEHSKAHTIQSGDVVGPVSPNGCFSMSVPLSPGVNDVLLIVQADIGTILESHTLKIERVPPYPVLRALPLAMHEGTMRPAEDLILRPGDFLTLGVSASPGATLHASIPAIFDEPIHLLAVPETGGPFIDTRIGIFAELHQSDRPIHKRGYYTAHVQIPKHLGPMNAATITLTLERGPQSLSRLCPGSLSLWTQARPARVKTDHAIMRTAPEGGARLTPQRAGTSVWLDGRRGEWWRVRLDESQSAWLHESDLETLDGGFATPIPLRLIKTLPGETSHQTLLWLPLAERLPLNLSGDVNALELRLYGCESYCDFVHYHAQTDWIQRIQWAQASSQTVAMDVGLSAGLSGYDYAYVDAKAGEDGSVGDKGLVVSLKTLPKSLEDIRILIDAGHGGGESGGTGCSGLPEKALNLNLSRLLADDLRERGFHVFETRTDDVEVSLARRGELARESEADLLISLHHNALPDGRGPGAHRGASTYYYHDFAQPLARALQQALVSGPMAGYQLADYGILYDNLFMTRIHQAMAVLVEVGFMTYPEEYEYLINPDFQADVAAALARAIADFCRDFHASA